ncbi:MAG: response regulator [Rhodobacteraceae bacterium]|nr:response regulator [Paracoccaceae bacterium]
MSSAGHHSRIPVCLLVEDNPIERAQITRLWNRSERKAVLISVPTLAEARRLLKENQVNLVLLDNSLPDGLGAEFALEISNRKGPAIAILSEWPTPFMFAKAERAGVLDVLRKNGLSAEQLGHLWDRAQAG